MPNSLLTAWRGGGGTAAGLHTSPGAVLGGHRDETGCGEWQDPSCSGSGNAAYQEQQAPEHSNSAATQNSAKVSQSLTCPRLWEMR